MKHRKFDPRRFALTAVALGAASLWGSQALALGLGGLQVQSVLGESLRAEVEVTSLTPEEAASLNLRVASAEAYRAAGVEYNALLSDTRVTLARRPDGRPVLRLSSDRAMVEPFVEVILEATWASGRLVREYTLLFDPPATRAAAAPAPVTPAVATPAAVSAPRAAVEGPAAAPPPVAAERPPSAARAAARAATRATPATPAPSRGEQIRVRRGDTLYALASRAQRPGVSLDQMLVALFRGNPEAFAGSNMNRLKAGAVLTVPAVEVAVQVPPEQARQIIVAQSADFAAYRQRLASGAAPAAEPAPSRQAAGAVQAEVSDRKQPAAPAPDKLKLSRAAVQASAPEARLSSEGERKDIDTRIAELQRNIEELRKLQMSTGAAARVPAPAPTPAPSIAVPVPPSAASAAPAPAPAAAPQPASAPASAPAPAAAEPGLLDSLLDSPYLAWAAGGLALVLVGAGAFYRLRQRKSEGGGGETSFLESRVQPDSFFGVTGGQRVDTKEGAGGTPTSMSYSLSQLDAIGDVDPVAEADVYLAYGRDLQAEEILKEAMRANPERLAVRTKLLEVYAKRRDIKGYEMLASQLHAMTQGKGEEWELAQAMGRDIDPENPLYAPGGQPVVVVEDGAIPLEGFYAPTMPQSPSRDEPPVEPLPQEPLDAPPMMTPEPEPFLPSEPPSSAQAVDLDLDLGLDIEPAEPPAPFTQDEEGQALGFVEPAVPHIDLDLEDTTPTEPLPPPVVETVSSEPPPAMESLDFDLGDLDLPPVEPVAEPPAPEPPKAAAEMPGEELADFELPQGDTLEQIDPGDPLMRKIELAEEFRQIGDTEGARDLLEEVVAKAEGALKAKAQGMLDGLG